MSKKVIKFKSYENLWDKTRFKHIHLSCHFNDIDNIKKVLMGEYLKHSYYILDSYIVQVDAICNVEFILLKKIPKGTPNKDEPPIEKELQAITNSIVDEYFSRENQNFFVG